MYNAVWWIELSSKTAYEAQDLEGTMLVEKSSKDSGEVEFQNTNHKGEYQERNCEFH